MFLCANRYKRRSFYNSISRKRCGCSTKPYRNSLIGVGYPLEYFGSPCSYLFLKKKYLKIDIYSKLCIGRHLPILDTILMQINYSIKITRIDKCFCSRDFLKLSVLYFYCIFWVYSIKMSKNR
mgnify:CR=1 FL=1